jgi:hypothetical protein
MAEGGLPRDVEKAQLATDWLPWGGEPLIPRLSIEEPRAGTPTPGLDRSGISSKGKEREPTLESAILVGRSRKRRKPGDEEEVGVASEVDGLRSSAGSCESEQERDRGTIEATLEANVASARGEAQQRPTPNTHMSCCSS